MAESSTIERYGQGTPQVPDAPVSTFACFRGDNSSSPPVEDADIMADVTTTNESPVESTSTFFDSGSADPCKWVIKTNNSVWHNLFFIMAAADASAAANDTAICHIVLCKRSGKGVSDPKPRVVMSKHIIGKAVIASGAAPVPVPTELIQDWIPSNKRSLYWFYPDTITLELNAAKGGFVQSAAIPPSLRFDIDGASYIELWPCTVDDFTSPTGQTSGGIMAIHGTI